MDDDFVLKGYNGWLWLTNTKVWLWVVLFG